MSKHTPPAVEMGDVRSWELPSLPTACYYHYGVVTWPGQQLTKVTVQIVWEPSAGVQFVLAHEGEVAQSPRAHHVTGAWIRAAARLHGRVSRETLPELIRVARWNLDAALPVIRA